MKVFTGNVPILFEDNWIETNQRSLGAALRVLRSLISEGGNGSSDQTSANNLVEAIAQIPTLAMLSDVFHLSTFETACLLLCAAPELDSDFPHQPTFSLALAKLPEAHWSAISPTSPLRYWRLVELTTPGELVTQNPLRIDERILHTITGTPFIDVRLPIKVFSKPSQRSLVTSQAAIASQIADLWGNHRDFLEQVGGETLPESTVPVIQLCGTEFEVKKEIAATACEKLGLNLVVLSSATIPMNAVEREQMLRLCKREFLLGKIAMLLDCNQSENDPAQEAIIRQWVEHSDIPLMVSGRERRQFDRQDVLTFDICKPSSLEQRQLWQKHLGPAANLLNGRVEALVGQFSLSAEAIRVISTRTLLAELRNKKNDALPVTADELGARLWRACSQTANPQLGELAQRIEPQANWADLVLPDAQIETLRNIGRHIRQRMKVYDTWGFAGKSVRGLGVSALFAGVSGTGKTMAAEVLANDLSLELYRIDLSQVISKYIGETEKNLRRVFDAAEESSAILLFDEADALFGKRSEVKDSHDRYANVEISYLLQRMEAYRGLAILTTNMKEALDQAFLRRLRFVIQFPFPDLPQRTEIWKRVFPVQTPTEGLEPQRLAKLSITGGNIRNIALYAAFLAADQNEPLKMNHLLHAARAEFAKLEKPLMESELVGWL